jgi:hypothetical protein
LKLGNVSQKGDIEKSLHHSKIAIMEAIIYKTKFSDFIAELQQRSSARLFVYLTTTKVQREKGVLFYEVVLSAFNLQNRVVHLRVQVCKAALYDSGANAKAEQRTKQQAETLKSKLLKFDFYVSSGIIGSVDRPIYGTLDDADEPTGAMD